MFKKIITGTLILIMLSTSGTVGYAVPKDELNIDAVDAAEEAKELFTEVIKPSEGVEADFTKHIKDIELGSYKMVFKKDGVEEPIKVIEFQVKKTEEVVNKQAPSALPNVLDLGIKESEEKTEEEIEIISPKINPEKKEVVVDKDVKDLFISINVTGESAVTLSMYKISKVMKVNEESEESTEIKESIEQTDLLPGQ